MGETLDKFRARYPDYDEIPDDELSALIIKRYPDAGKTDLMETARNYYAKTRGVVETQQSSESLWSKFKRGLSGEASRIKTGATELGRDIGSAVTESPNLRPSPLQINEEGEVTGQTMFQESPMGKALGIGQKEGVAPGIAELSKWLFPSTIQAKMKIPGGPTSPSPPPAKPSVYEVGRTNRAIGERAYPPPRPTRPSVDQDPYRITPAETPDLMPAPGPANEVAPSALDIAQRRAPLSAQEAAVALPIRPGLVTSSGQPMGNIGRTFLKERGSIDPNVAFILTRTAAGGVAGASAGDTGTNKIRYGLLGAAVGAAAGKTALGLVKGPTAMWRESPISADSTNFGIWAAKWKAKGNAFFLPEDIARGNPAATNIVREAYATTTTQHQIERGFLKTLREIYTPIAKDPASIVRIHRALDGQAVALSPAETSIAQRIRAAFNDMADRAGLPAQIRLADYFPHLRDEVNSVLKLEISSGGARPIYKEIPQDYRVFYEKPRRLPTDETLDFGLAPVEAYAKAAAKRIAFKGGRDLEDNVIPGFINRYPQHVAALPEVPELRHYFSKYINDLVHGPDRAKLSLLTPQMASTIKHVEFLRTIGANVMSSVTNLVQTLNTFAVTDMRSWSAAWYDIVKNKRLVDMAKHSGVVSQDFSKFDLQTLANPDKLNAALQQGAKYGGILFRKAEETNRLHAFAAGYRDAQRAGLTGQGAIDYAVNIVNRTQFRFGIENLPSWARGGSPELSVLGQFKSYQMNQLTFLRTLATDNPVKAIKYAIGAALIAGPDAVVGNTLGKKLRETVASVFEGDLADYRFRGALGEMGIYLGNQLGMGALPFENLSSLFFLIPGPALSHIMDAASVASGRDLNVTALDRGTFGQPLTPEQFASRLTAGISVPLNRARQAVVIWRTEGPNLRTPRTTSEAFGLESPTGAAGRPKEPLEALRKGLGIPSQGAHEAFEQKQSAQQQIRAYSDLVHKKSLAIRAGDIEEIERLNLEGKIKFGRTPVVKLDTLRRATEETQRPALERTLRHAPRPIRARVRKEVED